MKPTIGIPQCLDNVGRIHAGRQVLYSDIAYARAVERAGGMALHLPIQRGAAELISRVDALLLPGGDDFLPEDPHSYPDGVHFNPAPDEQVSFDRALLASALENKLPVLGICYGAQLIAIHYGGTLHHHLATDLPQSAAHKLPEQAGRHDIHIESKSQLGALLGVDVTSVNSLHQQAIASPGQELRIVAQAADGVIEAIENPSESFCIGVQWHPEKLPAASSDALFHGFLHAARENQEDRDS